MTSMTKQVKKIDLFEWFRKMRVPKKVNYLCRSVVVAFIVATWSMDFFCHAVFSIQPVHRVLGYLDLGLILILMMTCIMFSNKSSVEIQETCSDLDSQCATEGESIEPESSFYPFKLMGLLACSVFFCLGVVHLHQSIICGALVALAWGFVIRTILIRFQQDKCDDSITKGLVQSEGDGDSDLKRLEKQAIWIDGIASVLALTLGGTLMAQSLLMSNSLVLLFSIINVTLMVHLGMLFVLAALDNAAFTSKSKQFIKSQYVTLTGGFSFFSSIRSYHMLSLGQEIVSDAPCKTMGDDSNNFWLITTDICALNYC